MHQVAVVVGSLRRESINLRFARALAKIAAGSIDLKLVELGDVPLYNEDLWQDPPPSVLRLKGAIEAADAVLFVTPEYNRSLPAVTKNVIDWGSRPYGKNSWAGKPGAIAGTSPGAVGTAVAQSQLRSVLVGCGVAVLSQPEIYFTTKPGLIDASFEVADAKTREFLASFLAKFEGWITHCASLKS